MKVDELLPKVINMILYVRRELIRKCTIFEIQRTLDLAGKGDAYSKPTIIVQSPPKLDLETSTQKYFLVFFSDKTSAAWQSEINSSGTLRPARSRPFKN